MVLQMDNWDYQAQVTPQVRQTNHSKLLAGCSQGSIQHPLERSGATRRLESEWFPVAPVRLSLSEAGHSHGRLKKKWVLVESC